MALEPGRGRASVPVRSAILGAALAIATLVSALMFWSSLQHLVSTPRLSGFAWDVMAAPPTDTDGRPIPRDLARIEAVLKADSSVAGYARGTVVSIRIAGRTVSGVVSGGTGPASPVIVAGRVPTAPNEIALGRATMRQAGVGIGGTVPVEVPLDAAPSRPRMLSVVGESIGPSSLIEGSSEGEGFALPLVAALRFVEPSLRSELVAGMPYLIRFRAGVDARTAFERLQARLPHDTYSIPSQHRGDITTLGRITRVPLVLALLLGMIALGTLAQTLVTSVRARRNDLAILKTLGFSRRQVRSAVAWQATTLIAVALAVGLPLGVLAGRWIWRVFAEGIAVAPEPVLSAAWILAAIPATILLANLIAAFPARFAARTRPAIVLRSE
jgi:hypothetical protein